MTPVIGIVFCGFTENRQFVSHAYVEAISDSGGTPIIIPYSSSKNHFACYSSICDGILFCGGGDISPLLFDEELLTPKGTTDWKTDSFHLNFMKEILKKSIPVLCICRGMQVMNLALGGTIFQDISLRCETALIHMQSSHNRSDPCHKINIIPNSMLYSISNNFSVVNSFHHQCIHELGKNLQISALSSDGVIEAIEIPNHPFALGLQWHPECMYQTNPEMKKIFSKFIEKSKSTKKSLYL